jgi:tetratricopeptide (TPR) repeat protein
MKDKIYISVLLVSFSIGLIVGCQSTGYDAPLKPGEEETLQMLLKKALAAKEYRNIKLEEMLLLKLLKLSENKYRLGYWAANYHLGQLEYKKQNYRKAIAYYNNAHSVDPTNLEIYHRANAYYSLGKPDSAIQDYNQSIRFVKGDFVRAFPNSSLAKCDTCGFPFGSAEYDIFTEHTRKYIYDFLKGPAPENPAVKDIYDDLKSKEKNNQ